MPLSVILLHDDMVDKQGKNVTTSLTLIDIHDIARSCKTFGVETFYISHSYERMRSLAGTLVGHWEHGYGSTYNPDRKDALSIVKIVTSLDEALGDIKSNNKSGKSPTLIVTSAKEGEKRIRFEEFKQLINENPASEYLLALGTGWGMSEALLARGDRFLEPIKGSGEFNHLSVRSALAIMLSKIT